MEDDKKEPSQSSIHKKEDRNFNSKEDSESSDPSRNTEVEPISDSSIFSFVDGTQTDGERHNDDNGVRKLANRKKRAYHRSGKIQKRKAPSSYRRRGIKRTIVKRQTRRRNQNVCFQGLSAKNVKSANIPCRYCGHRCCRSVVSIQAGSRSAMLSPLFLGTNNVLGENQLKMDQTQNCQVSPEMIFEALQKLSKWTQHVSTNSILNHIQMNYPVNKKIGSLEKELREKLRIATVVGFVKQVSDDTWELTNALLETKLSKTHVTLFWKIYGDTMSPIKLDNKNNSQKQEQKHKQIEFPFMFKQ